MEETEKSLKTNTPDMPRQEMKNWKMPILPVVAVVAVIILLLVVIIAIVGHKRHTSTKTTFGTQVVQPAQVTITSSGFMPATIRVKVGQAVIWTNNDTQGHQVASDPYPTDNTLPGLNSEQKIEPGQSYSYIFKTADTYTYHDNLNPSVKGTVIVGSTQSGSNKAK